ncbi:MAG: GxxExxY protein [Gemmatimonadales bacterium]
MRCVGCGGCTGRRSSGLEGGIRVRRSFGLWAVFVMVNHRGTEGTETADVVVSGAVIGAALEVHRHIGPGLLESVYQSCLCHELRLRGVPFREQVSVPLSYKGLRVGAGYRMDLLVSDTVVVEVKAVDAILPIQRAQLLTYLKLIGLRVGLLINFNVETLASGIRRVVNGY